MEGSKETRQREWFRVAEEQDHLYLPTAFLRTFLPDDRVIPVVGVIGIPQLARLANQLKFQELVSVSALVTRAIKRQLRSKDSRESATGAGEQGKSY